MKLVEIEKRKIQNKINKYLDNPTNLIIDTQIKTKKLNFKSYFKKKEMEMNYIIYRKNRPLDNICISLIYKLGKVYIINKSKKHLINDTKKYVENLYNIIESEFYNRIEDVGDIFYNKKRGRHYDIEISEREYIKVFTIKKKVKLEFLIFLNDILLNIKDNFSNALKRNITKTSVNYISLNKVYNTRPGNKGRKYKIYKL